MAEPALELAIENYAKGEPTVDFAAIAKTDDWYQWTEGQIVIDICERRKEALIEMRVRLADQQARLNTLIAAVTELMKLGFMK